MPRRPPRCCRVPGCPGVADEGAYCPVHKREYKPAWATTKTSAHLRGYGARWRRLRGLILSRDPICRACQAAPSTEVDHIVGKAAGGEDALENLQGLCSSCHAAKTSGQSVAARPTRRR